DLPLHRIAHPRKQPARLLEKADLALRRAGVKLGAQLAQLKVQSSPAAVQQHREALGAKLRDKLVRVLGTGHRKDADLDPHLVDDVDGRLVAACPGPSES